MHPSRWSVAVCACLVTSAVAWHVPASARQATPDALRALEGEWIYVDDRTPGRTLEQLGPPMSAKFAMRVEPGAVILVSGHGSGHRDVRIALDGSMTTIAEPERTTRYRGAWKDGVFSYEVDFLRGSAPVADGLIRRHFQVIADGLIVRAVSGATMSESVAVYRHAADIALPTPATAVITDLTWLAGAWTGTRGEGGVIAFEERWSPPLGGAMLAVSRTVSRSRMTVFEYLRIVERDGGLVYIAQPSGAPPTEFVLTELTPGRAVFDNPRHDYPKRIVYERSADGRLTATTGFMKGGTPRRFEFTREVSQGTFFALSVADVARMSAWYRDMLGLRITASGEAPNQVAKFAVLEGEGVVVEIVEHTQAKPRNVAAPTINDVFQIHGIFKAGLIVADIEATYRLIKSKGVVIAYDLMSTKDVSLRSFSVRDPEGNLIQFFGK